MKHDNAKYNDREIRQIGMTAEHISRPDKVLFFADPQFFKSHCTLHTLASRTYRRTIQSFPKSAYQTLYMPIRLMNKKK